LRDVVKGEAFIAPVRVVSDPRVVEPRYECDRADYCERKSLQTVHEVRSQSVSGGDQSRWLAGIQSVETGRAICLKLPFSGMWYRPSRDSAPSVNNTVPKHNRRRASPIARNGGSARVAKLGVSEC